jgi:predicted metal-dependent hydrolase
MFILCLILLLFISIYFIYRKLYYNDNLVYEQSAIDNNYYWVRNNNDKSIAANTLAKIKINMKKLVEYLKENKETFPDYMSYINDLIKRTKVINIMETPADEKYTSYTINKGEKIVFCLRSKILDTIHDMNTLMYVVIHELAHVGCPEFGHTPLFKKIFKFLLKQSVKIGIYQQVDYRINPQYYCGMTINEYLFDDPATVSPVY